MGLSLPSGRSRAKSHSGEKILFFRPSSNIISGTFSGMVGDFLAIINPSGLFVCKLRGSKANGIMN